ncbi:MAG: UbiA family prenyltransferase [Cyclobacteriaceae bacterium]
MVSIFTVAAFRPEATEIETAILLFVDAFAGAAFCFLINDVFDREKDRLNQKSRPIATGALTVRFAIVAIGFFMLTYLIVSFLLGMVVFVLAIISLVLFTLYSPVNNRGGFIANILVAICASGSVWGVAIVRDYEPTLFYLSLLIFFMILIREILLDWLDISGDKAIGKTSIPILFGAKKTAWFVALLLMINTVLVCSAPFMVSISMLSLIALILAIVITWVAILFLFKNLSERMILFNIRFSHVTFVFMVIAILWR